MNHELNIEVVHWHINTSWHCCGCGASPLCDHTAHHSAARGPLVGHRGCGGDLGWVLVGCERGVGSGGHRRCAGAETAAPRSPVLAPQSSACTGVQGWAPGWVQGRVEDWEEHPDGETAWGGSAGHPRGQMGQMCGTVVACKHLWWGCFVCTPPWRDCIGRAHHFGGLPCSLLVG